MASIADLTAQVVALTAEVQGLNARLVVAEQASAGAAQQQQQGTGGGGGSGVFDKKPLYPKELKENTAFRSWAERFVSWISMDNDDVGKAFARAAKQDKPLDVDVSGLTTLQIA